MANDYVKLIDDQRADGCPFTFEADWTNDTGTLMGIEVDLTDYAMFISNYKMLKMSQGENVMQQVVRDLHKWTCQDTGLTTGDGSKAESILKSIGCTNSYDKYGYAHHKPGVEQTSRNPDDYEFLWRPVHLIKRHRPELLKLIPELEISNELLAKHGTLLPNPQKHGWKPGERWWHRLPNSKRYVA